MDFHLWSKSDLGKAPTSYLDQLCNTWNAVYKLELVRRKHPTMDRQSHLGSGSCSIPMHVAVSQCCCDRGEWWRPKPEGQEQKQKKSFSNLAGSP